MTAISPDQLSRDVNELCRTYLRLPFDFGTDDVTGPVFNFVPPLSAGEQTAFADLVLMAKFGITSNITLAEFQAIRSDLATDKTFVGIASPTLAQNNAATKSLIRIVGALLRQ